MREQPTFPRILGIVIGVLAVSCGAIFVRFASAEGAPALAISAWRLIFASLILVGPAWFRSRGEVQSLTRREVGLAVVSGTLLAVHFATWISSLEFTSVASSVALVSTYPLFAAVASTLFLGERLRPLGWAGILVSMVGSLTIALTDAGGDLSAGSNPLLGDALALAGAATGAGYFLVGRALRRRFSLLAYVTLTYGTAAVVLVLMALAFRVPLFGYSSEVYGLLLLLALVPQLIGHSAFNWALRYLSATFVTVTVVGEPIGATLLAFLVFDERPGLVKLAGMALILLGIVLVARSEIGTTKRLKTNDSRLETEEMALAKTGVVNE